MAMKIKTRIGTMPCERVKCESHRMNPPIPVVIFESETKTLSYKCDYCGRNPYAQPGTNQREDWMEIIKPFAPAAPAKSAPAKKPDPAAPEKNKSAEKKRPLF
jgi:hypothetical protein